MSTINISVSDLALFSLSVCYESTTSLRVQVFSSIMQEIVRIKNEHPDDSQCIVNDRVKGRLQVTRAFGAGFLKQVG